VIKSRLHEVVQVDRNCFSLGRKTQDSTSNNNSLYLCFEWKLVADGSRQPRVRLQYHSGTNRALADKKSARHIHHFAQSPNPRNDANEQLTPIARHPGSSGLLQVPINSEEVQLVYAD